MPALGSSEAPLVPQLTERLAYLLKHAQLRLAGLTPAALAPAGISGRELAVLLVLEADVPPSQQQAATQLGVDRTTMVALLDGLEEKDLITRRPHHQDRRRNSVELTTHGRSTLHTATKSSDEAQRQFLAPLSQRAAKDFMDTLLTLLFTDARGAAPGGQDGRTATAIHHPMSPEP